MKNQTYRMTMLFDFYGDILPSGSGSCLICTYNEDLSLSEIAENCGISRQGVRDVIVRAEAAHDRAGGQDRPGEAAFCRCSSTWTPSSPLPMRSRPSTTGSTKIPGWRNWRRRS